MGRWLSHFEAHEMRASPVLAIAAAWHAMFSNRPTEIERWLEVAQKTHVDGPLPDGTVDVPTAIAAVRMLAGESGVIDAIADAAYRP